MAFDLGFNNTDPTPEYTAAAIQKMDKRFDLVMITDRFEESIILMRDLLCMSEDDVIYLGMILKLTLENFLKKIFQIFIYLRFKNISVLFKISFHNDKFRRIQFWTKIPPTSLRRRRLCSRSLFLVVINIKFRC